MQKSCKALNLIAAGIVLLLLAPVSAWAQGVRQQIECEGYGEEKPSVQMSQFCAPGEYTNTCYNAYQKANRERDEYNSRARECKRRRGADSPPPAHPRSSGSAGIGNNPSFEGSRNNSPSGAVSGTASGVKDRLDARIKQNAAEPPLTKQKLDQLRREHNKAISDSQSAYDKRQQELVDERRQLDADLAVQRRNKARIQQQLEEEEVNQGDADSGGRGGCRPGEKWGRYQTTNTFQGWQSGCIPASWPDR